VRVVGEYIIEHHVILNCIVIYMPSQYGLMWAFLIQQNLGNNWKILKYKLESIF
jgi:hypothetical protein